MTDIYPARHGWTPGKFDSEHCRVMLSRGPCHWPKERHDPKLPPAEIDAFGYVRSKEVRS